MELPLTRQFVVAHAMDAANKQMRQNGRSAWNEDDFNTASRVFEELVPLLDGGLLNTD